MLPRMGNHDQRRIIPSKVVEKGVLADSGAKGVCPILKEKPTFIHCSLV